MGLIRINELARELQVKSPAVIEYLVEIGITDKQFHSAVLNDEVADKVRKHFNPKGVSEAGNMKG